eukprot:scaffold81300_cov12-Tisochrysis_lutea.AAC.1
MHAGYEGQRPRSSNSSRGKGHFHQAGQGCRVSRASPRPGQDRGNTCWRRAWKGGQAAAAAAAAAAAGQGGSNSSRICSALATAKAAAATAAATEGREWVSSA